MLKLNCVTFSDVKTHSVNVSPWVDPVSGTDLMGMEITVEAGVYVSFVANAAGGVWWGGSVNDSILPPAIQVTGVNETPSQTLMRIIGVIQEPRRPFSLYIGGKTAVTALDPNNTEWNTLFPSGVPDINRGPKVEVVSYTPMGTAAFMLNIRIKTWQNHCASSGGRDYLSLRWTTSSLVDEKGFTTLRTSGTIVLDTRFGKTNPDELRATFTPPLRNGFKRTKNEVTLQADGLAAQFDVEDVEYYLPPGRLAMTAKATHSTFSEGKMGAKIIRQVDVELEAKKDVKRQDLVSRAIDIAVAYLVGNVAPRPGQILTGSVRESLYSNDTQVSMKCYEFFQDAEGLRIRDLINRFGRAPLGSEPGKEGPDPGLRGSAGRRLKAACAKSPCLDFFFGGHACSSSAGCPLGGTDDSEYSSPEETRRDGFPEATVTVVDELPPSPGTIGSDKTVGVYESFEVVASYTGDQGKVAMPVSGGGTFSGSFDTATGTGLGKTTAIVQLYSMQTEKTFSGSATKEGGRPVLPQFKSNDPDCVLMNQHVSLPQEDRLPDGSISFTINFSATYVYLDGNSPRLAWPIPPWVTLTGAEEQALKVAENTSSTVFRDEKANPGWPV